MEISSILWVIKDFHQCPIATSSQMLTSDFQIGKRAERIWRLALKERDDTIEIGLILKENSADVPICYMEFAIVNAEFCEVNECSTYHSFSSSLKEKYLNLVKTNTVLQNTATLLVYGDLILHCKFGILEETQKEQICNANNPVSVNNFMSESFSSLLENKCFSDFVVQVGEEQYLCHKAMLACRSEVFSAMLKHNMREKNENKLVLTDIQPNILEKLLYYVYTGKLDAAEVETLQLLFLSADKYGLERLKVLIEKNLHTCLSFENAAQIFRIASLYNLPELKLNACLFISTFPTKTIESASFIAKFSCLQEISEPGFVTTENVNTKKETDKLNFCPNKDQAGIVEEFLNDSVLETMRKKKLLPQAEIWFCTRAHVLACATWSIGALQMFGPHEVIHSLVLIHSEAVWQVSVTKDQKYLSLHLALISCKTESSFRIEYKISMSSKSRNLSNRVIQGICRLSLNESKTILSSFVHINHLNGSDLTLSCSLIDRKSTVHECKNPATPSCDLSENVSNLLNDDNFTDAVIKVDKEIFHCHRAVLSCQSPYFASKFEEMNSAKDGTGIEIVEFNSSLFRKILSTIYTGFCELTEVEAWEALPLANKHGLFNLKNNAQDILISALCVENATKTLMLADSNNAATLKGRTMKYVGQNLEKIMSLSGWSDLVKDEKLFADCLKAIFL